MTVFNQICNFFFGTILAIVLVAYGAWQGLLIGKWAEGAFYVSLAIYLEFVASRRDSRK